QAKMAITIGAVVALAAAAAGPGGASQQVRRAYGWIAHELAKPRVKATTCLLLMAVAAFGLAWPAAAAAILVRTLACAALVIGAIGLFDLVGSSPWALAESP